MSMVQMWGLSSRGGAANDQSDDGSTVVSRQTADSWGGLAPPQRSTPYAPSETVRGMQRHGLEGRKEWCFFLIVMFVVRSPHFG